MAKPNHIKCLETQSVGKHKVDVYVESLPSTCCMITEKEFSFKVDDSTIQLCSFSLGYMYRVFSIVNNALDKLITNEVVGKTTSQHYHRFVFEAEGKTATEVKLKNQLYATYLSRFVNRFNRDNQSIICTYAHNGDINEHYLFFSSYGCTS